MKFNKRNFLRYRLVPWLVMVMIAFQSGPMQLLNALAAVADQSCVATSGSTSNYNSDEYKRFQKFESWST